MIYQTRWPLPPSVNSLWRSICIKGTPRVILSQKAKEYHRECEAIEARKRCEKPRGEDFLFSDTDCLRVCVFVTPRSFRRRLDLDNYLKSILDTLQKTRIIPDDKQVTSLHAAILEHDKENPGVEITISRTQQASARSDDPKETATATQRPQGKD